MRPFSIIDPISPEEVCELLDQGRDVALYAGGTELLLAMKTGLVEYDQLINIKGIAEFGILEFDDADSIVRIGATVTHSRLGNAARETLPLLADVLSRLGNVRVRNVGTIGGNLCFAEPASDIGTIAMLLEGKVTLLSSRAERTVDLNDFFIDAYETLRQNDEVLTRLDLRLPPPSVGLGYDRFRLNERPLATAGVALRMSKSSRVIEDARIVVGAVDPIPILLENASNIWRGVSFEDLAETAEYAARLASSEITAAGDIQGSERYKRHISGVMVKRACLKAGRDLIRRLELDV